MKTWKITQVLRRHLLFGALLLIGATQGCSCDSERDETGGDVALDARDISDTADVADTSDTNADTESDAGADGATDAEAPSDAASDGDTAADATPDAQSDAGLDASTDTGANADTSTDTSTGTDTTTDTGSGADADTGVASGDCISGATGTHAVRFQWQGSGPNSTAYVDYEVNELPDTSRWHVGAYSSNIGYSPVYTDTFLAEGGLELSGTVFIDVELSTAGLGPLQSVTIAVYGRSFATTSSGSFSWQTFSGTGATPSGHVHNSAPYQWYLADATAALPAGDNNTLLRLRAGPPSNSLVVNQVEICFNES